MVGPPVSRRQARRRALDILYEADLRGRPTARVLAAQLSAEDPPGDFTVELVRGVHRTRGELDRLIESYARDWKLARMPVVDRNVLRLGLFEILHLDDVPTAVAIDEAVDLAKELSTKDSGRFVNGVLARIADAHAPD
ncbi:MAG: transcription antitermination factor NusB [Actinobacteria bacterium]|nr:transcription antitermination factor NusB [Actinomycetota bacterium]